jgi:hypothetical protein
MEIECNANAMVLYNTRLARKQELTETVSCTKRDQKAPSSSIASMSFPRREDSDEPMDSAKSRKNSDLFFRIIIVLFCFVCEEVKMCVYYVLYTQL